MFYAIALMLITLWLLGLVGHVTMGGFIHTLPAIAFVLALLNFHLGGKQA